MITDTNNNKPRKKWRIISGLAVLLIIGFICIAGLIFFVLSGIEVSQGSVDITQVIVTDDPNQDIPKTTFPVDTQKIYGRVYIEAQNPVPIKIRWYYVDENILFHEDIRKIDGFREWFISPSKQTGEFTPGKYRFEAILVDDPVKVVNFEIK
jgi:hypothetical protein